MKKETLTRIALGLLVSAAIAAPLTAHYLNSAQMDDQVIEIHARTPENGGWSTSEITMTAGEEIHLHMTSDDVMHSFTIGESDQDAVDIVPGKWSDLTLRFDQPGRYTFYCTRWCGPNHWRMRGEINVVSAEAVQSTAAAAPLYVQMGLDLDATPVPLESAPASRPAAERGAAFGITIPQEYTTQDYWKTHSPADLFTALKAKSLGQQLSDNQVWDLVAYVWTSSLDPAAIAEGQRLYAQNCAACHGESGGGNGAFSNTSGTTMPADPTAAANMDGMENMEAGSGSDFGHEAQAAANFTDDETMLALNSARLQGKIIRGGMGTGMPYWGPIFSDEQTWSLVAYLWTFAMD